MDNGRTTQHIMFLSPSVHYWRRRHNETFMHLFNYGELAVAVTGSLFVITFREGLIAIKCRLNDYVCAKNIDNVSDLLKL